MITEQLYTLSDVMAKLGVTQYYAELILRVYGEHRCGRMAISAEKFNQLRKDGAFDMYSPHPLRIRHVYADSEDELRNQIYNLTLYLHDCFDDSELYQRMYKKYNGLGGYSPLILERQGLYE